MIKRQTYISHSPDETFAFGKKLGASLGGGEVLALSGGLGAGKTALVQGVAAGLGLKDKVNSPTFTIMKLYSVKREKIKQLCHIDAYRLNKAQELLDIGAGDYLGRSDTVSAVEWSEKMETILPANFTRISLRAKSENIREIIIK